MNSLGILEMLYNNGIIIKRARTKGRSLDSVERNIILCGRKLAKEHGLSERLITGSEMEGERDKQKVYRPTKVKLRFAYYVDFPGDPSFEPEADFFVVASNHPSLPVHGNLGAEQIKQCGVPLPKHPSYETWVKKGRKNWTHK